MPNLSFKCDFFPLIDAGLKIRAAGRDPYPGEVCKLQTIRARGKRRYKAGDTLYLCVGLRTSAFKRWGTAICREVLAIDIYPRSGEVVLETDLGTQRVMLQIDEDEIHALAVADGFQSTSEFFGFFRQQYGDAPFAGQLIKW